MSGKEGQGRWVRGEINKLVKYDFLWYELVSPFSIKKWSILQSGQKEFKRRTSESKAGTNSLDNFFSFVGGK